MTQPSDVAVIGAGGRTGRRVVDQLLAAGHTVTGLVRRREHATASRSSGAAVRELDLASASTADLTAALAGVHAVVFAAGSHPGDPPDVVRAINHTAAVRCVDAAIAVSARHLVMVSAHRVDEDFGNEETLTYLRARRQADAYLRAQTALRWTIVRPDALSESQPTGLVELGRRVPHGVIPRADLATVIVSALSLDESAQFEVVGGRVPIERALAAHARTASTPTPGPPGPDRGDQRPGPARAATAS